MTSEFVILIGVILAGTIFLTSFYLYTSYFSEESVKASVKSDAENLVGLIYRIFNEPSDYAYFCKKISLTNLTIDKGILTFQRGKYKFSFLLPKNVSDVRLEDTVKVCLVKSKQELKITRELECRLNGVCEPSECRIDCADCTGPNDICINDGYCNPAIGENCENSRDCICGEGVCCPSSKDADLKGCSKLLDLEKGEECWCDVQCRDDLECNPTASDFKDYKKACCEPGKVWNGSECVVEECSYPCVPGCKLPPKWDWRNVNGINYLNPIRDQGTCGSCWAFATIGSVENVYNVEKNCPACNKDLSEQNLVSNDAPCCGYCGDCNAGRPHEALKYVKIKGVVPEDCFPYVASTVTCNLCSDYIHKLWKIETYGWVSNNLEEIKRMLVCKGPLVVATPWPPGAHAMVLVGYDDNSDICKSKYSYPGCWIIRNSWGIKSGWLYGVWHESGYGYIPYSGIIQSNLRNYVLYVEGVQEP